MMMMSQLHPIVEVHAHAMPEDYQLQPYDVLNGRGKMAFNYVGNRRFRITLGLVLSKYQSTSNRHDKSCLITSIVQLVRRNGGHFLNRSSGRWMEVGDRAAREKVGHALRDMVGHNRLVLARKTIDMERSPRSSSPSCVMQDPFEEEEDPLDVSSNYNFPDQYIQTLCHVLSSEDDIKYGVGV